MLNSHFVVLAIGLLGASVPALGKRVDFVGRPKTSSSISRRAFGASALRDESDTSYFTNITLGGVQVEVQIDTGSSDLWVLPSVRNSTTTGQTSALDYAVGHVEGPINLAQLEFAGYVVPQQAFLQADSQSSKDLNIDGIIGLGPDFGSSNLAQLAGPSRSNAGNTPLASIFAQNASAPDILTFTLGRLNGAYTDPAEGTLTIGEILPGMEAVSNQPKLNIVPDTQTKSGKVAGHWAVLLDKDGVKVNGKTVNLPNSVVTGTATSDQLLIVMDSGFSLPQVPKAVTDAMYSTLPGAKFQEIAEGFKAWVVPCNAEVNVTWSFGGKDIPIHPLDVTIPGTLLGDPTDTKCYGLWQPIGVSSGSLPEGLDAILGMAFLRNTYALINMGNLVGVLDSNYDVNAQAFMQLLPTTDTTKAHAEFAAARLNSTSSSNGNGSGSGNGNGNGNGNNDGNGNGNNNGNGGTSGALSLRGQLTQFVACGALLVGSFAALA